VIRFLHASLLVVVSSLEMFAARLSEDAKRHSERQYYIGYEQGVRDGRDGAEHALQWLAGKETKR
jgi:hypothetical protein